MRSDPDDGIRDGISFRDAVADDLEALTRLARATYVAAFGAGFTPEDLEAHLAARLGRDSVARMLAADRFIVAWERGHPEPIGFAQIGTALPEDLEGLAPVAGGSVALRRLYVVEARQNRGIGSRLLERALADASSAGAVQVVLDVWEHNSAARRLYERFGFRVAGRRRFEVASGAPMSDDLVMVLRPRDAPGRGGME